MVQKGPGLAWPELGLIDYYSTIGCIALFISRGGGAERRLIHIYIGTAPAAERTSESTKQ